MLWLHLHHLSTLYWLFAEFAGQHASCNQCLQDATFYLSIKQGMAHLLASSKGSGLKKDILEMAPSASTHCPTDQTGQLS
jgi:hypothetical protein